MPRLPTFPNERNKLFTTKLKEKNLDALKEGAKKEGERLGRHVTIAELINRIIEEYFKRRK